MREGRWIVFLCSFLLPLALVQAATFTEDFTQADGAPEGWVVVTPTVTVASGQLTLAPGGAGEVDAYAGQGGAGLWFENVTHIEFDMSYPGNPPSDPSGWPFDHGGVMFCAQKTAARAGNTCYVLDYLANDLNTPTIGRFRFYSQVTPDIFTVENVVSTGVAAYEGKWEIDLTETNVSFTLNGVEQFNVANADLPRSGYVGFWAFEAPAQNKVAVDNLSIEHTPGPCHAVMLSKLVMTQGKSNALIPIRMPAGANDAAPFEVTVTSADPATALVLTPTVTFAAGDPPVKNAEVTPVAGGQTMISLTRPGEACDVSIMAEVLGIAAFAEDFTQANGPPEGWYIASPTAQVINKELSLSAPGQPFVWFAIGGVALNVPKIEAIRCKMKFAPAALPVGAHGGIYLGTTPGAARDKGYMIDVIERASDNGYRIYKDNNAAVQLGGPRQPYVRDNLWHDWEVEFTPTGFTFKVDGGNDPGEANVNVQDLTYRGGYLSFWCYTGAAGQNVFVDDVRIEFGTSACPTIAPSTAANHPINRKSVFTVTRPYDPSAGEYSIMVTSTDPAVAVPFGGTDGSLVLTWPAGDTSLTKTFEAECVSPGTTTFVLDAGATSCLVGQSASFTVRPPGQPEFCDTFTQADGAPAKWSVAAGGWQVAGEKLVVECPTTGPGNANGEAWIWAFNPSRNLQVTNMTFNVTMTQTTPGGVGRHGGFMFFANSPTTRWQTNGYEIDWIDRVSDQGYRISRYDNGVATPLATNTGATFPLGTRWWLSVNGTKLEFYVDDAIVFNVEDTTYREGYFAFWTYCNTTRAEFDNVQLGLCRKPAASFTADPTTGEDPLTVAFDASGSTDNGIIAGYAWDFGDGATAEGVTATHTYEAVGAYTVTLTVTDNAGNADTETATINVVPKEPNASFTADPTTGMAPLTVAFDASASTDYSSIASYAWVFGDGAIGTGVTTTHTYETEGAYTVTLTVTDDKGNTDTVTETITVTPAGTKFKRGDTNQDNTVNIADAISCLSYLFAKAGDPAKEKVKLCLDAADANDSGVVDIADAITILGHLFAKTGPLPDPFDECDLDPTKLDPEVECETFTPCATP